jgi:hypothetical protein
MLLFGGEDGADAVSGVAVLDPGDTPTFDGDEDGWWFVSSYPDETP